MSPPRITAGAHKNRRLAVPEGQAVRPTAERTREALFDILAAQGRVWDAAVLDLFAGTGAIGLEALSRGAAFACFVEQAPDAARCIEANVRHLGETQRTRLVRGDATRLKAPPMRFDWAYLDPPYRSGLARSALGGLLRGGWLQDDALVVVELAAREEADLPDGLVAVNERRYGAGRLLFAGRA
ncbi:MAG: 16S rRNA (guanine(966)-N(2))-methyltransferase RsmD [Geminicoccaceae bacterium]|nr:16S rRNA (guanine(966)-N(2))-methyltransferase RsmD [Geminicoccaceae bacterium]